jgi:iron-sulfur cluster repair protein YtfE (RIC family)
MEIIKPLKRSAHLTPLSRDHHNGLLLCWKIRQGIKHNIENLRIVKYLEFCFENELKEHFEQEERLVFSLVKAGDPEIRKAIEQHQELKSHIRKLTSEGEIDEALLARFADHLEQHIRFEERILFPYIEKNADPDSFDHAGKIIAELHSNISPLSWEDEFWVTQTK